MEEQKKECTDGACRIKRDRQITIETDGDTFKITKNELGKLELTTILQVLFNRINN
jgi:hypothetical protein